MKKTALLLVFLMVLAAAVLPQGTWKDGGLFGFEKPSEDISFVTDTRKVVHAVARNGTELRHYMRGSKNPYPWETEGRVIPGDYTGSGHISIWADGNLFIIWPRTDGQNGTWWEKPRKFIDPSKIKPPPVTDPVPPLIGGSYYGLGSATRAEIKRFISNLRANGGNATEIFLNWSWPLSKSAPWRSYSTSGHNHSLYKITGDWSEDKFGNYKFPTFDLTRWDSGNWSKLKLIMEECRKNGIALFIRIQDYCSVKDPFGKRHYAYNKGSNEQAYSGGMYGEPIQQWYKIFNRKLMATIHAAGLKFFYIIPMNETEVLGDDWPGGQPEKDRVCIEFINFYIKDFKSLGVRDDQFILNIHMENPRKHFEDLEYTIEHHHVASPPALQGKYDEFGANIFPNGDGPDPEALGIAGANGNREGTYAQGFAMGRLIKLWNLLGYCYFLRSCEPPGVSPAYWSSELAQWPFLRGLAAGIK